MLEITRPYGANVRAYRSRDIETCIAQDAWKVRDYWKLRSEVFVSEQGIFDGSDRDTKDDSAYPIVALSLSAGMPDEVVGVVRIYRETSELWYGGRLAVRRDYRRHGLVGERLIQRAVGSAKGASCTCFLATVQQRNVRYFERQHFEVRRTMDLHGLPHALMEAKLAAFEPLPLPVAAAQVAA